MENEFDSMGAVNAQLVLCIDSWSFQRKEVECIRRTAGVQCGA